MAEESGSSPDIVSRVRDVRYYFEDGGVVFLCENKLYKLHKTRLALKSEFFTELFEVPQDPNSVVHGHDDNHPVNLNESGITDLDFRHLLIFLYDQDELPNPTPLQFFFSVLHLSMLWRIQSGVKYVTTHLPNHADFTPAIQLKLSRQYSLDDWAGPAFRTLIQRPLAEITLADAEHIGVVTYYKLMSTIPSAASTRTYAPGSGSLFWWGGYSKQLLHPDNKKSPASILLELDPTKGLLAQMNKVCLQNTMEAIWENNPFDEEQELADDAYSKLCAWMDTL
ncbi:BTB domain-containing protein [Mycena venus]|uniref:BTB domain-containing protein n=1 Tax=Mycena venus TaxID=2733690 RepID=A0A8H6YBF8_9AGAR|nr:BTB domain-containing protein [Mycena venus]